MSNRFDTALINREQTRQRLSEALDAKFVSEERWRNFSRVFVLSVIGAVVFYVAKGAVFVADNVQPIEFEKKRPTILAQMKSQLAEGSEPLLIGGEDFRKKNAASLRTRGGPGDFASGKIPPYLYLDLNAKRKSEFPGFAPPSPREQLELQAQKIYSGKPPPFDCGRYRPAAPDDLKKLAAPRQNPDPKQLAPLYAQLPSPPLSLATDEHEFPK